MSQSASSNKSVSPSIRPSNSQGEFLLNEEGWKDEARGVIQDISSYVKFVSVAENLPSSNSEIYLNLTTKENNNYTIVLNPEGFKIVGNNFDTANIEGETVYETPYSLLDNISPAYREAFGNDLTQQLLKLQKQQEEENSE